MQFHLYCQFPAVIRRHHLVQTQCPMAIPRRHSMVCAQFISAFLAAVSFQAGILGTDHLAIRGFSFRIKRADECSLLVITAYAIAQQFRLRQTALANAFDFGRLHCQCFFQSIFINSSVHSVTSFVQ